MAATTPLLVVGSVALDSVEAPAGKHDDVLGGSASFFAAAASYFVKPHLVAVVGTDFPEEHVAFLRSRGVDCSGLERVAGRTFRWAGRYARNLNSRTTLDTQLNVFADFKPKLTPACKRADLVFLANIEPSLQLDVLQQVASEGHKPRLVAMDTMNFWIEGRLDALKEVLKHVDLLMINDEEARLLAGPQHDHGLPASVRAIRQLGPRTVIVKRGDAGALLFHDSGVFAASAFPLDEVIDPTGAGDSFAGGFMGYLAAHMAPGESVSPTAVRKAMVYGTVMASFCVEAFSLDRLRALAQADIDARYRAFLQLTHIEGGHLL